MMQTQIMVKLTSDRTEAIVRRVTLNDDGTFQKKEGLTKAGDWLIVAEGERYPDECILPVSVTPDWIQTLENAYISVWKSD
jgi:hypothetical protein